MDQRVAEHLAPYMRGGLGDASLPRPYSPGFDFILDDSRRMTTRHSVHEQAFGGGAGRPGVKSCNTFSNPQSTMQPARLSLPRPNIYDKQSQELRDGISAGDYDKIRQNLHEGRALTQYTPRVYSQPDVQLQDYPVSHTSAFVNASRLLPYQSAGAVPSPLSQIANAMLCNQPLSTAHSNESTSFWQQQQRSQINQLQPQQQQVTPPFHQAFHSVEGQAIAQSSSPIPLPASSPSARISARRSVKRSFPASNSSKRFDSNPQVSNPKPDDDVAYSPVPPAQSTTLPHIPPTICGIQLQPLHELPDKTRQIFPFELFNAVQSKCFRHVYHTNDNFVVSAPTGSGKTAILELAICKLVDSYHLKEFKIVYQAPTKSLCSERFKDWEKKFRHLGLKCAELTGDTDQKHMGAVRDATIIVTTPEKWDSITRKWSDHDKLVAMVKLFLIDEVHILKDLRGATLEAVVSRMRKKNLGVRFVALSATIPNAQDIATWLGKNATERHLPAKMEIFGEEFRPVRLQKIVHAYDGNKNGYAFEKTLDPKIESIITRYSCGKPIMVFCLTRRSCELTAESLAEWWKTKRFEDRPWPAPLRTMAMQDKKLQGLASFGVAFHHAGLDAQDREAVEHNYLKGDINLICCTSTLAVGVNLPCHLVILKGTFGFQNGVLSEYADLEVMQMLGRAGRPQFDDSAIAVIMTRKETENRYQKLVSGHDFVESTLHLNLIEHLNSEICLQTVHSTTSAKEWIKGTFLSVRMRQNPRHYKLEGIAETESADRHLEFVCERDLKMLRELRLITKGDNFECTEYGRIMSKYMVQFETMKLFLQLQAKAKTEDILHMICQAVEFKDLRIKPVERPPLRELNKSPFIKFPIKGNISTTTHKIMLLVQVKLGGVEHPNEKESASIFRVFVRETTLILERIYRLVRCVIDCKVYERDAVSVRHGLDLARSLSAGFWENSNLQLQQLNGLGPAAVRKFASHGITTIQALFAKDTFEIECIMSKNPPYGRKLLDQLAHFPRLKITAQITREITTKHANPRVNVLVELSYRNKTIPVWKGRRPFLTFIAETTSGDLAHIWKGSITKLEKNNYEVKFTAEIYDPDDEITCYVACDEIVATLQSHNLKPSFPPGAFRSSLPLPSVSGALNKSRRQKSSLSAISDEFDCDIEDDVLLEVMKEVEGTEQTYDSDDFVDIATFTETQQPSRKRRNDAQETTESVLLPNGKWSCNHACSGGQLLKNGKPCKHKCCAEGLDKPRKAKITSNPRRKETEEQKTERRANVDPALSKKATKSSKETSVGEASQIKATARLESRADTRWKESSINDSVEIFDLTDDGTQGHMIDDISDVVYGSRTRSSLGLEADSRSPTTENNFKTSYGTIQEEDSYNGYESFAVGDHDTSPLYPSLYTQDPSNEFDDAFNTRPDSREYASTASPDHVRIHSPAMVDVEYSNSEMMEELKETPTGQSSSFVNALFDFEAYEDKLSSSSNSKSSSPSQVVDTKKRARPCSPDIQSTKRRQHTKENVYELEPENDENTLSPPLPSWVHDFDPKLIDELKGFVEFVD